MSIYLQSLKSDAQPDESGFWVMPQLVDLLAGLPEPQKRQGLLLVELREQLSRASGRRPAIQDIAEAMRRLGFYRRRQWGGEVYSARWYAPNVKVISNDGAG